MLKSNIKTGHEKIRNRRDFHFTHFMGGLFFGAGLGAWDAWGIFDHVFGFVAAILTISLVIGCFCGYFGEDAWAWIGRNLWWFS